MSIKTKNSKLIVILGPTASGKTRLALRLAEKFNGEIVNADSRQIYREMDIGTGKIDSQKSIKSKVHKVPPRRSLSLEPACRTGRNCDKQTRDPLQSLPVRQAGSVERLQRGRNNIQCPMSNITPIHLVNIINPDQKFSLSQYKKLAITKIRGIQKQNKIPFLVGGTGLYISSVVDNLEIPKASPDDKIRERLESLDTEKLFEKLKKIDLKSAEIIGENNKRKLIRALEVYEITGQPFSKQQTKGKSLFDVLQIGIKTDREKLYKKIDQRVDKMVEMGLVEETKNLVKKYSFDLPAMSGIGYREIGLYLQNKTTLEEAVQRMKFRTHQYARRQMTWFRRDEKIEWVENYEKAEKLVLGFL